MEEQLYLVEYYYDRPQRQWRADVIDEEGNIVDFVYAYSEHDIKMEAEVFKIKYQISRITKTSVYR